jgi:hypothetical protein
MPSLAIPSAVTAALPAMNIHSHGHGHKKGSPLDPTADSPSSSAAQNPAGSTQTLLGSLFNSLRQVIGARAIPAVGNPVAASTNAVAGAAASAAAAAGSKINVRA